MTDAALTEHDVERFVRDGAVRLTSAFSRELADECRQLLWAASGCDEHDRTTWTKPMVRVEGRGDAPFVAAANTKRLHTALDQLAGEGRWLPRDGLGTFPIRFPVDEAPTDDGWHIESTGADAEGHAVVDPASRERVLLLLFLFSDVGPADAPTRVRLGSHHHAARLLVSSGRPAGRWGGRPARNSASRSWSGSKSSTAAAPSTRPRQLPRASTTSSVWRGLT